MVGLFNSCQVLKGRFHGDRSLKSSVERFPQEVKISIGNRGLDILFISAILAKCAKWHAVRNKGCFF
jgi:hypothetical protein